MENNVIERESLPPLLFKLIPTEKVRVSEFNGIVQLEPILEDFDVTAGLRGMFKGCPEMTVDKFLESCRADKELDL